MSMQVIHQRNRADAFLAFLMLGSFVIGVAHGLVVPVSDAYLQLQQHLFEIRTQSSPFWIFEIIGLVTIAGILAAGIGILFGWRPSRWFLLGGIFGEIVFLVSADLAISTPISAGAGTIFHLSAGWLLARAFQPTID